MSRSTPRKIPQACAVPYRHRKGRLEFCLITSIRKGNWQFPKGIVDPGETPDETALKEAHEEAGLHGRVFDEPLGKYSYAKWGATLRVTAYLMEVEQEDERWDESDRRKRRWCDPDEALELINRDSHRRLLGEALARLAP